MQRLAIFVIVIMPLGAHGFPAPKGPELTLADFLVGRWELTGKDRKVASSTYFVEFTADGGYKVLALQHSLWAARF